MTAADPVAELLFTGADTPMSTDPSTVMSWAAARDQLAAAPKFWLATGRPDGRPHVMPVVAVWSAAALYVATRPTSRKGRNLAGNPHCVLSAATATADLVVECRATVIDDPAERQPVLAAFEAKYEWRLTVRDGAGDVDVASMAMQSRVRRLSRKPNPHRHSRRPTARHEERQLGVVP